MSTRVEVGRDPPFQGFQMKFLQAVSLSSERSLAGEVRQRRPSPLLQGSPVQGRRLVGARVGGLRFVNERLEAVGIQLTRSDAQHVTWSLRSSAGTTLFGWRRRLASTVRCFGTPSGISRDIWPSST